MIITKAQIMAMWALATNSPAEATFDMVDMTRERIAIKVKFDYPTEGGERVVAEEVYSLPTVGGYIVIGREGSAAAPA